MVSVIASHMRNRREYKTLTELFDKADVSRDGAVSLEEVTFFIIFRLEDFLYGSPNSFKMNPSVE